MRGLGCEGLGSGKQEKGSETPRREYGDSEGDGSSERAAI
jgi:hypothetical protein